MANVIETTISINDNMSKAFQSMSKSINLVISNFESLNKTSGKAIDTKSLAAARKHITDAQMAFNGVDDAIDKVRENVKSAGREQSLFTNKVKQTNTTAETLKNTIRNIATTIAATFGAKKIIELSDTLSQTKARLDLMNDGMQTTAELQNMISQAAKNSRGSYQAMADMVAKLGINAGDAFSSTAEIVDFAEQVNKQFTISGAGAQEASAASLQLTQALASGVLRGDELNSIFEQAPTLIRTVADHLGVSVGSIREMASEGEITADIVKTALLEAADETNKKFEAMPKTFGQVWTDVKNQAMFAFQPMLEKLNEIANSEAFSKFVNGALNAFTTLSPVVTDVVSSLMSFATSDTVVGFFNAVKEAIINVVTALGGLTGAENPTGIFETIAGAATTLIEAATPVISLVGDIAAKIIELSGTTGGKVAILGLATAFGVLKIAMAGVAISDFITKVKALSEVGTFAAGLKSLAMSTKLATAAQWLFNTSLYGCPIVWIIAGIIALIAIIVLCVKYWDNIKAAAVVCWDAIKNAWGAACDWFKGIWEGIKAVFSTFIAWVKSNAQSIVLFILSPVAGIFSYLYNNCEGFRNFVQGVIGAIKNFFVGLWNGIVSGAQSIWSGIVGVFTSIKDFIVGIWNSIVATISSIWATIWGVISPVVYAIRDLISAVWGAISSIISALLQGIWATIVRVWTAISTTISNICTAIWNTIVSIWTTIWTTITAVCTTIWNTVVSIWTAIWTTITSICTTIWNTIVSIWNSIVAFITPILQIIKNVIVTAWNGIKTAVSTAINAVKSVVTSVWNNITTTTSNIWNNIKTTISNIWNNIVSTVTNKVKEVYTKIKNKFDEILEFLGGLKEKFVQKGKDIIQGLIDGFTAKLKGVADKIREVGETVTAGIKDFFDINSPSKVMRELGRFTFAGFDVGLQDMINRIKRTSLNMGEVVTKVVPAADGTATTTKNPDYFRVMRETVSKKTVNNTTLRVPINIEIKNDNTINNDVDVSDMTRRLANGIAQQIGLTMEGI